ncbi:MAG: hypothetical protein M3Y91_16480 [Actinomycetota bacterium]|nr:hypothetical protein [Actinomycetota bacterium]
MSAGVGPNRAARRAAWPKRRQWLDRIGGENRLTTGAKAWLMLLAKRSVEEPVERAATRSSLSAAAPPGPRPSSAGA